MKRTLLYLLLNIVMIISITHAQQFSIIIDAQKDAFYGTLTSQADGFVFLPARCFLSDAGTSPDNDADCSGKVWFAYDEEYLYCYAEVRDDIVLANTERFQNDCLELKLDPDPNSGNGTGGGTANSRLTALGVDDAALASGVDNLNGSGNLEDSLGVDWVVTDTDYARARTEDGYALEFRIPFKYINKKSDSRYMIKREMNAIFGLAINIGDNDLTSRDHIIQWSAGHANAAHTDPKLLGSATFLADHKLKLQAVSPRDPSIVNDSANAWYSLNATSIRNESNLAKSFTLSNNYPNPFNPNTAINFSITYPSFVSLKIYNNLGQQIENLLSKEMKTGGYKIQWNAEGFTSGVYYYRLTAGKYSETKKLVLLK